MLSTTIFALVALGTLPVQASVALLARDQLDYINSMCSPKSEAGGPVPPCVEATVIETACTPNGTEPLALEAHAQCMCKGSYFSDWAGCQSCLLAHGARSPRDMSYYSTVIVSASNLLCTGTPTAPFQSLFTSAQRAVRLPTTGDTASSDRFPSQTAVSLYATVSGSQGPGAITGSATAATAKFTAPATPVSSRASGAVGTATVQTAGGTSSTTVSTATTSASKAAAPTRAVGGMVIGVAGGIIVAML